MAATETRSYRDPNEIAQDCLEAVERVQGLVDLPEEKRSDTYARELRTATARLEALDREHDLTLRMEQTALEVLAWEQALDQRAKGQGPEAANQSVPLEARSFGQLVTMSDGYQEKGRMALAGEGIEIAGRSLIHEWLGGGFEMRTLLDSDTTSPGNGGVLLPRGTPIFPTPRTRRLFVRDLLSVQQTGLSTIPYVRELLPATTELGASSVAEGGTKPEVTMDFEAADAPVRKIAAWIPVTNEVLDDVPTLRGYIDTRLGYMLALREELEILKGNGVAPDLTGIYNTTGTQTQSAVAGDVPATIAAAIGKVENVDGEADGIVMNPLDFWGAVATRHSTLLDGDAVTEIPFGAPPPGFWGLPVVRTRSLDATECLVGSFRLGATLFDRMTATIRSTDNHDDYFVKNKTAILIEERIALAVHRPDFFVEVTIDLTA